MKNFALPVGFFLLLSGVESLEQFTPDKSNWSTFNSDDHSPDGISWIDRDDWQPWDGTVYDPTNFSKQDFVSLICPGGQTVRGVYELFYEHNPFADVANPTKAEVDNWHAIVLNHVRAMVGYTEAEYVATPDKCLHLRALWSDERFRTRMWDTDEYPGTCSGSNNPHCGASFLPNKEDQQEYLPDGISECGSGPGSEGLFSAAKSSIPWSIKWVRPFCNTLGTEGFWGGHTGPWFHRPKFGWSWYDLDPLDANSNAGLRAKWSGSSGAQKYENPDITNGKFTVNVEGVKPDPRFPGYECEEINWLGSESSATECYNRVMGDDNCGKRFMTYNNANDGCACYPPDMAVCEPDMVAGRLTWDFEPVASSFDGLLIDTSKELTSNSLPYRGRVCPQIIWKTGAGDASHCLQKIIEGNYDDCGRKFITFNANGGGCACYPPDQETCKKEETTSQSGRETYELEVDPSYNPDPIPCAEYGSDIFFLKRDGDEELFQSCNQLRKKGRKQRENICQRPESSTNGTRPAKDVCRVTCGTCPIGSCEEKTSWKFWRRVKGNGNHEYKTCKWLSEKKNSFIRRNCKKVAPDDSKHPAASERCPITCGSCSD